MISKEKLRKASDVVVFARNHHNYLEAAADRNMVDPEKPTTFRARSIWSTVLDVLQLHKTLTIYFSPVGGKGDVEYFATLHHVRLHPKRGDHEPETYLGFWVHKTANVLDKLPKSVQPYAKKLIHERMFCSRSTIFRRNTGGISGRRIRSNRRLPRCVTGRGRRRGAGLARRR